MKLLKSACSYFIMIKIKLKSNGQDHFQKSKIMDVKRLNMG